MPRASGAGPSSRLPARRPGTAVLALGVVAALFGPIPARALDMGPGQLQADINGTILDVFTYRPTGCVAPSLMIVFHGNGRTAQSYRNSAQEIADRGCFVIYAPLFDEERFPSWSYHRGGVAFDSKLRPESEWTVELVDSLIEWARQQEDRPDAPVFLFGHSAGGQFLSRAAAYALDEDVSRIVIANPSTQVMPNTDETAPYGFGLFPHNQADERLRDYLAAPVTVFLGLDDTGDEDLTMTEAAQRQGENRLERGRYVFEQARRVAMENGWPFNWRLIYADDVGHTARGMLTADELVNALGF